MQQTRTPLPAGARALRDGRYEVDIARPSKHGAWLVYATGRFTLADYDDAVQWAADNTPVTHLYTITRYAASNGWVPQSVAARVRTS